MKSMRSGWLLALLLAGCADAQPTSPEFEQRLFSVLGGLEVGEALTLFGEAAESVVLQGGPSGAVYVFIPFLAAEEGAARLRVDIQGEDLVDPGPSSAWLGWRGAQLPIPRTGDGPLKAHLELRAWEQRVATPLLRNARARIAQDPALAPRLARRAVPAIDEVVSLRVPNRDPDNADLCQNPKIRSGRVTAVTPHAILVEDVLNPVSLSPTEVQRIAEEYEEFVYPISVENFGEPTDVDENGRVYVFLTSALNESAAIEDGGLTVGFTFALDLLPREVPAAGFKCPASNEAEIFYLIAPDPNAVFGTTVTEEMVRRLTTAIVVHELQHMINAGRRLYEVANAQEFEEVWLNEGLSHIAEELVFYASTGILPRSDISWDRLTGSERVFNAYNRFIRGNVSSYADYLANPDEESLMGKDTNDDGFPTRGAAWAFLRYLADQTPTADPELFHALVNSPVAGIANLERVLEDDPRVWMQRWTVASYTDGLADLGVEERYRQPSWNFRDIYDGEVGSYPLALRLLAPDATISLNLPGGASSYLVLRAKPRHQARVNTTRIGQPTLGQLRISVVRIE